MRLIGFFLRSPSPILSVIGASCLACSILSFSSQIISDYNARVRSEQFDRQMRADHGATFSNDEWGDDFRKPCRLMMLTCAFFGFLLTLGERTYLTSIFAYFLAGSLAYGWFVQTAREASYNTF